MPGAGQVVALHTDPDGLGIRRGTGDSALVAVGHVFLLGKDPRWAQRVMSRRVDNIILAIGARGAAFDDCELAAPLG